MYLCLCLVGLLICFVVLVYLVFVVFDLSLVFDLWFIVFRFVGYGLWVFGLF